MRFIPPRSRGFTLVEMLMVLAIASILVFAVAKSVSSRQKPAVISLLDQLEGQVQDALVQSRLNPGQTLQFRAAGSWSGQTLQIALLNSTGTQAIGSSLFSQGRQDLTAAGIDINDAWVGTALSGRTALSATPPCDSDPFFTALLPANLLCDGSGTGADPAAAPPFPPPTGGKTVFVNPISQQFTTPFHITVVGLAQGQPYAGAPIGYLVVSGNRVFKFYSPGPSTNPAQTWRRL
jgi:prepilin-type N-terminal cleavage/methylation domain-containing protein